MGERGRVPEPTWLQVLKGNPGKRKLNKDEPQPKQASWMPAPDYLDKERIKVWQALCKELSTLGILYTCDRFALERYCEYLVKWRTLRHFLEVKMEGNTSYNVYSVEVPELRDPKDNSKIIRHAVPRQLKYRKPIPEVAQFLEFGRELLRLESHFGLTPSARSRLTTEGDPESVDDDFEI